MKKIKLFAGLMAAVMLAFSSASTVFAETYHLKDGLKYMLDGDNAYIAGIEDDRTVLEIPAEIDGYSVTATTMYFAQDNTNLESVSFKNADNISVIGSYSFYNCTSLKSVDLGSHVSELYRGVFRGCTSLETAELSDSLTEIPYECFYDCSSLKEITLGRNITSIQSNSFTGCNGLTIICYFGSYAHQFAKDNNIPYKLLDEFKLGDVNDDGYVNINDVTAIQRYLAEIEEFNELQTLAADINRDGNVDVEDATVLQRFLAEYDVTYPIGEVITQ